MLASRTETSPPATEKIAEGKESGPGWCLTLVYYKSGAISSDRRETLENISEVKQGGCLPSVVADKATGPTNASAISCGFLDRPCCGQCVG